MKSDPANIYEADNAKFSQETERLKTFELPNTISLASIGEIKPGSSLLDVGAGSSTSISTYVREHGGTYTALDKNKDLLEQQKAAGATTVFGDIRQLPFEENSYDTTHARFVIAHLGDDKQKAIKEVVRVTKPAGRAIFIDFDWTVANGSRAYNEFASFLASGETLFDAGYGSRLEEEVRSATEGTGVSIKSDRETPELMFDYSQVLKLREAGSTDFRVQGKEDALKLWNDLLDRLQTESELENPPGFHFPDLVVVTVSK